MPDSADSPPFLSFTLDKFTFRVATDRTYTPDGLWAREDGVRVLVGVSDYLQQHNGDVVFAEAAALGTLVAAGEPLGQIETIKIDLELASPISGEVVAVNPYLDLEAEIINQDPYGAGWLVALRPLNWPAERETLLSPEAYFERMRRQAEQETGS